MNKLFLGPAGGLKERELEEEIRKLLCVGTKESDCACLSCQTKLSYHPDFLEVSSGKKEDISEALSFTFEMPSIGNEKVVLISNAEVLTPASSNALLKAVEEGPGAFVFSSSAPLIETLMSRVSVVRVLEELEDNTYGLSSSAFSYATGKDISVVREFAESGFFATLKEVCDLCVNIKERKEWLEFFNLVKEKDSKEFFSSHTAKEVEGMLKLLGGVFFSVAIGTGRILPSCEALDKLYTKKEALICCESINRFLSRKNANKNDFFVLVASFV